jgi:Asp-tRNA(Asn)/Glu-tRNA(Gln) amidotransferase A subunit family amidase
MSGAEHLTASEAAARLEAGTLTAEALVRDCLDRAAARRAVQAWVWLDPEHALAQARAVDHAGRPGVLKGVPVGVKDVIDTYDMPTQHGSPIYRGNRPFADAACVALTRAAGGVILGKTVTTEFANRQPRETVHPLNPAHTPGGPRSPISRLRSGSGRKPAARRSARPRSAASSATNPASASSAGSASRCSATTSIPWASSAAASMMSR